jgi:hypothetical protein
MAQKRQNEKVFNQQQKKLLEEEENLHLKEALEKATADGISGQQPESGASK